MLNPRQFDESDGLVGAKKKKFTWSFKINQFNKSSISVHLDYLLLIRGTICKLKGSSAIPNAFFIIFMI